MKRHAILAILTLVTILAPGLVAASTGDATENQPSIEVPEPIHDFGKVIKGNIISHDFEIRNTGTEPLELRQVQPDCGCTVTRYDRVIAPGESGKVHAEIDTSVLLGPTNRAIQVFTNDPDNPVVHLTFKADVEARLHVEPGYARYQVVQGETKPGILKQWIWAIDGEAFQVVSVDSPYPYLNTRFWKASAEERKESGPPEVDQWIVETHLEYNQAPVGPLTQEVTVHTDHPRQKRIQVPVSGFIRPSMWSTPAEVDLGEVELEEPRGFSLVVQSFLGEDIEITEVTSDLEGLETEVVPMQEGRKFAVRCIIDPAEIPKGPFSTTIKIKTNTDKAPVLEVPFRGTIL